MLNRAQRRISNLPTDLHRVFDANGELLYVGIAVNVFSRLKDHKRWSIWWQNASIAPVIQYTDRAAAIYFGALAIQDESPFFNRTIERVSTQPKNVAIKETMTLVFRGGEVYLDA